jgi:hypothetical protein
MDYNDGRADLGGQLRRAHQGLFGIQPLHALVQRCMQGEDGDAMLLDEIVEAS